MLNPSRGASVLVNALDNEGWLLQTARDNNVSDSAVVPMAPPADAESTPITGLLSRLALLAAGQSAWRVSDEAAIGALSALDIDVALIRTLTPDAQNFVVKSAAGRVPAIISDLLGTWAPATSDLQQVGAGHGVIIDFGAESRSGYLDASDYDLFEQLHASRALIVPLIVGGHLVGRFDLIRTGSAEFSSETIGHAGILAAAIATALDNEQLSTQSQDVSIHRAVFDLYQQIEHLADPRTILQAAVDLARQELGCDRAYAMLWDNDRREFMPIAVSGIAPWLLETLMTVSLSPQVVPAIDAMMRSGDTIVIEDAAESALMPGSLVEALDICAAMLIPLRGRQRRTLGFILLGHQTEGLRFTEADERIMAGMIPPLATMIENAMLYEDVVASSDSLAVINEIGIQLAMLADEESLFRQLYRQIGSAVDGSYFALGLLDESRKTFDLRVAASGEFSRHQVSFEPGNDAVAQAVQLGRASLLGSAESFTPDQWTAEIEGPDLCHSQMIVPVTLGRSVVGALTVRTPARYAYGPHDLSVFGAIAVHTGVALENARLYRIVQERGDRRAVVLGQVLQQQETERKELVDDIHDDTLQTLAACLFSLDNAHRSIEENKDVGQLANQIEEVRSELASNIDRLRKRIFAVRPATLDVLGLEPALGELIEALQEQSMVQISLEVHLSGRLATRIETAVYRLVQAAISLYMAPGRSGAIAALVTGSTKHVVISVHDFQDEPIERHKEHDIAMLALIERTELLGGSIRRTEHGANGSLLQITLPLDEAASKGERYPDSTAIDQIQWHGDVPS